MFRPSRRQRCTAWDSPVKRAFWKNLAQYVIGFGLLAVIIYRFWDSKPGKPNDNEKALSLLAGSPADVNAQIQGTTPGLLEVFSRPVDVGPLALACVLWIICLFITFVRWYILVRAQ